MKVITTHKNPDFDAISSCIAAKKLYPDAKIQFPPLPERSTKNFIMQSIIYPYLENECDPKKIDTLIIVDTHSSSRLDPRFQGILGRVRIICYDHHREGDLRCDEYYHADTGANVTQMVEMILKKGISISEEEATLFMLGIYQDTGKLSYSSTTPKDMMIAAQLLSLGADLDTVRNILEETLTEVEVLLLNELIKHKRVYEIKGKRVGLSFSSLEEYVGNVAGIVTRFMKIDKLDAAICIFRMASRLYVIARSRKEIDVSELLKPIGGGGHKNAASASVKDKTLIEMVEELNYIIKSFLLREIRAKDIMSYPPKYIYSDEPLKNVWDTFSKSGVNALVVLEKGSDKIVGIVTRQAVDRATHHRMENEPISSFMETEFSTVEAGDSFEKARKLVVENKQKLIPVTENGRLVGVITRTNLLKLLSTDMEKTPMPEFVKNIAEEIRRALSPVVVERLTQIGEISKHMGFKTYLIGGAVRDIILGIENPEVDLDIAVEGMDTSEHCGVLLAREVARQFKAKIAEHPRFGTASIIFDDGTKMDIATTREESYNVPGALPDVERSSLKLDLYRRDFTINTLAVKLHDEFGDLFDFFGALKDIRERKIRVLHVLSFIDDPTRIFRAIRFASKLDFEIGKQTRDLIKSAINAGALKTLSKGRIFNEIKLILKTPCVRCSFELLKEYGILKSLNEKLNIDERILTHIERLDNIVKMQEMGKRSEETFEAETAFLILLEYLFRRSVSFCRTIGAEEHITKYIQDQVSAIIKVRGELKRDLNSNLEIYEKLSGLPMESVLALYAIEKENKNIEKYLNELRHVKPCIRGKDLLVLGFKPSKLFSEIIHDVFKQQLNGKIRDKAEAIEYIKNKYLKEEQGVR